MIIGKKNKIEKQLKSLKNKKVDICYTNLWIKNDGNMNLFRKKLPSGKITNEILFDYPIYISSVLLKSKIIKKNKIFFNPKYEILGDFDFFYKLSKKFKFKNLFKSH